MSSYQNYCMSPFRWNYMIYFYFLTRWNSQRGRYHYCAYLTGPRYRHMEWGNNRYQPHSKWIRPPVTVWVACGFLDNVQAKKDFPNIYQNLSFHCKLFTYPFSVGRYIKFQSRYVQVFVKLPIHQKGHCWNNFHWLLCYKGWCWDQ